ncbi:MAG: Type 1 glutamine amidotransferase-like domain-containing protein [Patescibacteria group bacterium]
MSTLFLLSSTRFLKDHDLAAIIGRPWPTLRIAHIITAAKGPGVDDLSYLERTREIFRQGGAYFEDFDLDGQTPASLRATFPDFNAVFVNGGSTFYLLKSIRQSGFESVIKELLTQGFIYMGGSAGTYVACPTIEMALWRHQDRYDHCSLTDLTGMNLVPFLMTVHYLPEYRELLQKEIPRAAYPVRILSDKQALLVKDGREELIGGPEIRLV